eukprot:m.302762 g.302762  ORF g.302762 m.302762 type:complete len:785 (+) comp15888_c0_seq2:636-2990(+)
MDAAQRQLEQMQRRLQDTNELLEETDAVAAEYEKRIAELEAYLEHERRHGEALAKKCQDSKELQRMLDEARSIQIETERKMSQLLEQVRTYAERIHELETGNIAYENELEASLIAKEELEHQLSMLPAQEESEGMDEREGAEVDAERQRLKDQLLQLEADRKRLQEELAEQRAELEEQRQLQAQGSGLSFEDELELERARQERDQMEHQLKQMQLLLAAREQETQAQQELEEEPHNSSPIETATVGIATDTPIEAKATSIGVGTEAVSLATMATPTSTSATTGPEREDSEHDGKAEHEDEAWGSGVEESIVSQQATGDATQAYEETAQSSETVQVTTSARKVAVAPAASKPPGMMKCIQLVTKAVPNFPRDMARAALNVTNRDVDKAIKLARYFLKSRQRSVQPPPRPTTPVKEVAAPTVRPLSPTLNPVPPKTKNPTPSASPVMVTRLTLSHDTGISAGQDVSSSATALTSTSGTPTPTPTAPQSRPSSASQSQSSPSSSSTAARPSSASLLKQNILKKKRLRKLEEEAHKVPVTPDGKTFVPCPDYLKTAFLDYKLEFKGPAAGLGYRRARKLNANAAFKADISISLASGLKSFQVLLLSTPCAQFLGLNPGVREARCALRSSCNSITITTDERFEKIIEWPLGLIQRIRADFDHVVIEGWVSMADQPGALEIKTTQATEVFHHLQTHLNNYMVRQDEALARDLQQEEFVKSRSPKPFPVEERFLSQLRFNQQFQQLLLQATKTNVKDTLEKHNDFVLGKMQLLNKEQRKQVKKMVEHLKRA